MNINELKKFELLVNRYQLLYGFLIISISTLLVLGLLFFQNVVSYEYEGVVEEEKLVFSNLNANDLNKLINTTEIIIEKEKLKFEIIDIVEFENQYSLLLNVDLKKKYFDKKTIKAKFIVKEESLYQFILNNMKGES